LRLTITRSSPLTRSRFWTSSTCRAAAEPHVGHVASRLPIRPWSPKSPARSRREAAAAVGPSRRRTWSIVPFRSSAGRRSPSPSAGGVGREQVAMNSVERSCSPPRRATPPRGTAAISWAEARPRRRRNGGLLREEPWGGWADVLVGIVEQPLGHRHDLAWARVVGSSVDSSRPAPRSDCRWLLAASSRFDVRWSGTSPSFVRTSWGEPPPRLRPHLLLLADDVCARAVLLPVVVPPS